MHTYPKGREGSLKKPLSSDIGRSTYQIAPPWVHNKHHLLSGCGSFKFKLDQLTSVSFLVIRKFVQLGEWGRNPYPSAVLFEVPTHKSLPEGDRTFLPCAKNGFQQLLAKCTLKSSLQQSTKYGTTWRPNRIAAQSSRAMTTKDNLQWWCLLCLASQPASFPKFSQLAKIQHILEGVGHKDVIKILGSSAAFSSWSNRSLFSTVTEMEKTEHDKTEENN